MFRCTFFLGTFWDGKAVSVCLASQAYSAGKNHSLLLRKFSGSLCSGRKDLRVFGYNRLLCAASTWACVCSVCFSLLKEQDGRSCWLLSWVILYPMEQKSLSCSCQCWSWGHPKSISKSWNEMVKCADTLPILTIFSLFLPPSLSFSFSLFRDSCLSLNSTLLAEETLFSRCVRTMNK